MSGDLVYRVENGHGMEMQFWRGQGGGIEDVVVWCHTCDPEGKNVMRRDYQDREDITLITQTALEHSKNLVEKGE